MKHLLLPLLLCLASSLTAQDDPYWFVKNHVYTNENGAVRNDVYTVPIKSFKILGQSTPDLSINDPGVPTKDVFIIYKDGSHFNSRGIFRDAGIDPFWNTASTSIPPYRMHETKNIQYLYWTNVYEGDENPDGRIEVVGTGAFNSFPSLSIQGSIGGYDNNFNETNNFISANHNLVKNRDITLIIFTKNISYCTFDICFDEMFYPGSENAVTSALNLSKSDIFPQSAFVAEQISLAGSSNLVSRPGLVITNNCIKNFSPATGSTFAYVNLRVPENFDRSYLGSSILFQLKTSAADCPEFTLANSTMSELVLDTHDPNYVEVMCVTKKTIAGVQKKFVKYRAQLMNDGVVLTEYQPSFNFTFPFPIANSNSIEIKDFYITTKTLDFGCLSFPIYGQPNVPPPTYDPITGNVEIKFMNGKLEPYDAANEIRSTAWVEFCVEIDNPNAVNLQDHCLFPSNASTDFSGTIYGIHNYIDHCVDKNGVLTNQYIAKCSREIQGCDGDCDCGPPCSSPPGPQEGSDSKKNCP